MLDNINASNMEKHKNFIFFLRENRRSKTLPPILWNEEERVVMELDCTVWIVVRTQKYMKGFKKGQSQAATKGSLSIRRQDNALNRFLLLSIVLLE